jgi:hypothetical protein
VALLETEERPLYQRVAQRALHLREPGFSYRVIATRLGVDDKAIAKAHRWLLEVRQRH